MCVCSIKFCALFCVSSMFPVRAPFAIVPSNKMAINMFNNISFIVPFELLFYLIRSRKIFTVNWFELWTDLNNLKFKLTELFGTNFEWINFQSIFDVKSGDEVFFSIVFVGPIAIVPSNKMVNHRDLYLAVGRCCVLEWWFLSHSFCFYLSVFSSPP